MGRQTKSSRDEKMPGIIMTRLCDARLLTRFTDTMVPIPPPLPFALKSPLPFHLCHVFCSPFLFCFCSPHLSV